MKKVLLVLAVALTFTLAVAAQESSNQTSTTQTTTKTKTKKAKSESKEKTLTGCLAAGTEPDTFKLMEGKKSVEVTGQDLAPHVGHEVKLTGTWEKEADAKAKMGKEFKVANIQHISDTCSASKSAGKMKMKSKSKTSAPATPPPSSK